MATSLIRNLMLSLMMKKDIKHAVWDSQTCITQPIVSTRVYNRIIDVIQLMDKEFISFDDSVDVDSILNTIHIPRKTNDKFVPMEEKHLDQALSVLNQQFDQYTYHPIFTKDEFKHLFFNNKIVSSFVQLDDEGKVVDMISYYQLDMSTAEKNDPHVVKISNLFYYTATTVTRFQQIRNALIKARDAGFELFSATDIGDDSTIDELGFEKTDNVYHSFVGNWKTPPMKINQVCKFTF